MRKPKAGMDRDQIRLRLEILAGLRNGRSLFTEPPPRKPGEGVSDLAWRMDDEGLRQSCTDLAILLSARSDR
jgi:hypothetical protein